MKESPVKKRYYAIKPNRQRIISTPSKTQQHYAAACDIKTIVKQCENQGLIANQHSRKVCYMDRTLIDRPRDEIMNELKRGNRIYNKIPKSIREGYGSEMEFVEAIHDPKNQQKFIDRGLFRGEKTSTKLRKIEIEKQNKRTEEMIKNHIKNKTLTEKN